MHKPFQKYNSLLFFLFLIFSSKGETQVPVFSNVPNMHSGDSVNITILLNNGTKVSRGKVIGWFPKDSLSTDRMNEIMDTINLGIIMAEKFIKAPLEWQVHQEGEPYTFYFRRDSFVSHASGAGFVSIPFWRIKRGKAPWLHEALHEMFNTKAGDWFDPSIPEEVWSVKMPIWLSEGLPEYICHRISEEYKLPQFDVFSNARMANIDSICKLDLQGPRADSILYFIGKAGVMEQLSGKDRRLYAPTFYHCSCSFVKYLAEIVGVDELIASLAAVPNEMEELERRIPNSLEEMKKMWLKKVSSE